MPVLTIRDVPEKVRKTLADEAAERGQSLQSFLLGVLTQRAEFNYNRELLIEVEADFAKHGGAGKDVPPAAEFIRQARREAGRQ